MGYRNMVELKWIGLNRSMQRQYSFAVVARLNLFSYSVVYLSKMSVCNPMYDSVFNLLVLFLILKFLPNLESLIRFFFLIAIE